MKKIFYLCLSVVLLCVTSCQQVQNDIILNDTTVPSTQVFVQRIPIQYTYTRANGYGDKWPHVESEWEAARFSIRIDGRIPGYQNQSSTKYWGGFSGPNLGKVFTMYPYGRYNDRDFDYYKVDTKTGNNIGLFRYVFDPEGVHTLSAIKEIPDVKTFLTYVKDNTSNLPERAALTAILESQEDLKVIWYVVKEVGMQYGWHVNGILTFKDVTSVDEIPDIKDAMQEDIKKYDFQETDFDPTKVEDGIEYDIHLQEHKDWNEIKTSVHIRTDVDSITINIPLKEEDIVEQDDFAIRVYEFYYKEYYISHEITHNENGITIVITNIKKSLINELKSRFGDGLTIEIHSYTNKLEGIFEDMKKSTVIANKDCNIKGQITSAYQ